ncbi:MAG: HAD family hydrolase [Candidatus Odinarchaeota archaeon]
MPVKAVIFDFDGTVVDSMPFLETNAVKLMVQHYSISKHEAREKYIQTTGLPFLEQIGMLFPGHEANETVIGTFEQWKENGLLEQPLFPDTKTVFEYLKSKTYLICISSSSLKPAIEDYFRRFGYLELLDEIMGYRPDFQKGKDHFDHVKQLFKLDKKEMVFIGDSLKDFERAKGSGIRFIGRLGLFSQRDFTRAGHDGEVISSLSELHKLL